MEPATLERTSQIKEQIRKVCLVYLKPGTKVFIFGSQANKDQLVSADIDIGIEGKEAYSIEELWEFKEILQATPNLFTFDVVDFKRVTDGFRKIALKNTEDIVYVR